MQKSDDDLFAGGYEDDMGELMGLDDFDDDFGYGDQTMLASRMPPPQSDRWVARNCVLVGPSVQHWERIMSLLIIKGTLTGSSPFSFAGGN